MFLDCAINYFESPTAYGRPQLFDIIKRVRLGDFKEESKVAVPQDSPYLTPYGGPALVS
jgi:hypothetical protein